MRYVLILALFLAGSGVAGTVYQVTGPEGLDWSTDTTQILYGSWTQSVSFSNVDIYALLAESALGTAYLTKRIGPAAVEGDVIASTRVASGSLALTHLFSLPSLGPGTYYLVIGGTGSGTWPEAKPPTVTTAAGVSANGDGFCGDPNCNLSFTYRSTFTASTLNPQFLVTSGAAVPEPATMATIAATLLALAGYRRLRRRSGTA